MNSLSKATQLQAIHLNFLTGRIVHGIHFFLISAEDALQIVRHCSTTVTQIGSAGRVWQVGLMSNIPFGESYKKSGYEGGDPSGGRQDDDGRIVSRGSKGGP